MLAIRTILYPTDFSEPSMCAGSFACALAKDYGARLIILHMIVPPAVTYGEAVILPDPEETIAAAREQLDHQPALCSDLGAERRLEEGNAVEEILRVGKETGANLIVMGTHGRTGLERLLVGSVAEEVVRKAHCPVLTVKVPIVEPCVEDLAVSAHLARAAEVT